MQFIHRLIIRFQFFQPLSGFTSTDTGHVSELCCNKVKLCEAISPTFKVSLRCTKLKAIWLCTTFCFVMFYKPNSYPNLCCTPIPFQLYFHLPSNLEHFSFRFGYPCLNTSNLESYIFIYTHNLTPGCIHGNSEVGSRTSFALLLRGLIHQAKKNSHATAMPD